ncbi:MAG: DNA-3-methyladenine glycosylase 2 family protein [Fimbriimonadaceae bacterium]|nr:DNA-3-methyladenine glycosylase 2 family protein [Fimbriimonadaceae bacterium]
MGGAPRLDVGAAVASLARCEVLGPAVARLPRPDVEFSDNRFRSLVRAIVYQQLNGAVATVIYNRFLGLFPPGGFPSPEAVAAVSTDQLRSVGLSRQKAAYIQDLAGKVADGALPLQAVDAMDDDEVRAQIVQVKGLGDWSADMFLIFALNRPDVWPSGDLGVRKGLAKLLRREDMKPAETTAFAERWRPYRSAAAWYMWRVFEERDGSAVVLP